MTPPITFPDASMEPADGTSIEMPPPTRSTMINRFAPTIAFTPMRSPKPTYAAISNRGHDKKV